MARVKIKHPTPNNNVKLTLLRILSEHLIYATKIIPTPDSYKVLTRSDDGVDKIFQATCPAALKDGGFDPHYTPAIAGEENSHPIQCRRPHPITLQS
ncbi:hypothetical protein E2C01_066081 [Portunus trituberculatus]|uniref:Uncharacterized protein n=1 Tax=Portunus trituberculatus TaxID=210409 RepID=A0A5B7HHA1_PORTR|nr:hypothetical protein [Portunus trituberculatus]